MTHWSKYCLWACLAAWLPGAAAAQADLNPDRTIRDLHRDLVADSQAAPVAGDLNAQMQTLISEIGQNGAPHRVRGLGVQPEIDTSLIDGTITEEDLLSDPTFLEVLLEMPQERAAIILEAARTGQSLVAPVLTEPQIEFPSMTDILAGDQPDLTPAAPPTQTSLSLRGWSLVRGADGALFMVREGDPASMLPIQEGMVVGEIGEIVELRPTSEGYLMRFSTGDVLMEEQGA